MKIQEKRFHENEMILQKIVECLHNNYHQSVTLVENNNKK